MRRVVIHRPGGYDVLTVEEQADPVPAAGEVSIIVEAAGVNYADCITRMGLYSSARKLVGFPITPGFEVAGRVDAIGPGVVDLAPGDRVLGATVFGGYASRIALPADQVLRLPDSLGTLQAAGFSTAYLTAWFAIHELCRTRPGDHLLVHSAAGGVGGAIVRLGKLAGCRVVAVVGAAHKVEAARAAGADEVIDKSRTELWPAVEAACPAGFQAAFDANGLATLMQSYRHLAPMGRLVVYGFHGMLPRRGGRPNRLRLLWSWLRTPRFDPLRMTASNRCVMGFNLSFLGDRKALLREALAELLDWQAAGRIEALPVTPYPIDEVGRAHADLESGQTVGKLVLTM